MTDWVAIIISVVSLAVAVCTVTLNKRSAVAAEDSAVSAGHSADAAKASAESANRVAEAEINRDHEMYRPQSTRTEFYTVGGKSGATVLFSLDYSATELSVPSHIPCRKRSAS